MVKIKKFFIEPLTSKEEGCIGKIFEGSGKLIGKIYPLEKVFDMFPDLIKIKEGYLLPENIIIFVKKRLLYVFTKNKDQGFSRIKEILNNLI